MSRSSFSPRATDSRVAQSAPQTGVPSVVSSSVSSQVRPARTARRRAAMWAGALVLACAWLALPLLSDYVASLVFLGVLAACVAEAWMLYPARKGRKGRGRPPLILLAVLLRSLVIAMLLAGAAMFSVREHGGQRHAMDAHAHPSTLTANAHPPLQWLPLVSQGALRFW